MSLPHQTIIRRFVAACQADERVLACFLGGSNARGTADAFSDLDLYVITTDEAYEAFCDESKTFMQALGEPLFAESFNHRGLFFFILADGTEGELGVGKASAFEHIHAGPYTVLVDKARILDGVEFALTEPSPQEQTEALSRILVDFWHDVGHLLTALGRGQLWWAMGQLEILRGVCIRLARLEQNFLDSEIGDDPYFKLDKDVPPDMLAELAATYCPMEKQAITKAAHILFQFYKRHGLALATRHGVPYPATLEQVMLGKFETLRKYQAPSGSEDW